MSYYFSHLEGELFIDYTLAPSDDTLIKVSSSEFSAMLKKKNDYDKFSNSLSETANNNNIGIAFEKSGNIDSAIEAYERKLNIAYPALHSYERLMVLYRKEKRYDDEIRVIEKAINDFPIKSHKVYIDKWKERLSKAKLKSK
ncbi:tetratricopeptide repeat protein [Dysgonomonas capnocytophagoides]|uniref:tetratricopeptide repeat protein n=1 Tax=Dysgonomonas capnocytophagoides TaxID=45254 RepID=UPI0033425A59